MLPSRWDDYFTTDTEFKRGNQHKEISVVFLTSRRRINLTYIELEIGLLLVIQ